MLPLMSPLLELPNYSDTHRYVTYRHLCANRSLLAVETNDSFLLWLAKFKYQKTCL